MSKQNITAIFIVFVVIFSSCKKCKQCFLKETHTKNGTSVITSLGEKCGAELKSYDGKKYDGTDGPVYGYCEE